MGYKERMREAKKRIINDVKEDFYPDEETPEEFAKDYDDVIQELAHYIDNLEGFYGHEMRQSIKYELRKFLYFQLKKKKELKEKEEAEKKKKQLEDNYGI